MNVKNINSLLFKLSLTLRKININVDNINHTMISDEGVDNLNIKQPYLHQLYNLQIIQNKLILSNNNQQQNLNKILNMIHLNYLFNLKYLGKDNHKEVYGNFIFETYILGFSLTESIKFLKNKHNNLPIIKVYSYIQKAKDFMKKYNIVSNKINYLFSNYTETDLNSDIDEEVLDFIDPNISINNWKLKTIPSLTTKSVQMNSPTEYPLKNNLTTLSPSFKDNYDNILKLVKDYLDETNPNTT